MAAQRAAASATERVLVAAVAAALAGSAGGAASGVALECMLARTTHAAAISNLAGHFPQVFCPL